MAARTSKASFLEPMLLLPTTTLPEGPNWGYELKLDGYRALAIKTGGAVHLRSRNNKDFNGKYPSIAAALASLPDETILDGEVVAVDQAGRPSFNLLQNCAPGTPLFYYVFDLLMLAGEDITAKPLSERLNLLVRQVLAGLRDPIRQSPQFAVPLAALIHSVREQGLEGIVAKRLDARYESGQRTGAWLKMRINRSQDLVIAGYTTGGRTFDAVIFGYYDDGRLVYAGRTRVGFTPAVRDDLFRRFRGLEVSACPFVNLPEPSAGRWGQGLTAEKMKACRWLRPELVGRFEFVEWTPDNHLRHSRFLALQQNSDARKVRR